MSIELCTWCGAEVDPDDGFRAAEPGRERRAVFCRLEHVVPWSMQGCEWGEGSVLEPPRPDEGDLRCAHCGCELDDLRVLLVRHRGSHRIADDFCSAEHLAEWAKAGGRWR